MLLFSENITLVSSVWYFHIPDYFVFTLHLQDKLDDMEESKYSIQRELKDKERQLGAEKRIVKTKDAEVDRLKAMITQRDELLKVCTSHRFDSVHFLTNFLIIPNGSVVKNMFFGLRFVYVVKRNCKKAEPLSNRFVMVMTNKRT